MLPLLTHGLPSPKLRPLVRLRYPQLLWARLDYLPLLSLLAGVVILAGAAMRTRERVASMHEVAHQEASEQARQKMRRVRDYLDAQLKEMEAWAKAGASLNPLHAMISQRVDRATLEDAFGTEEWWRPYREEFPISVLHWGEPEPFVFARDPAARQFPSQLLLSALKQKSPATEFAVVDAKPYIAAVTVINVPYRGGRGPAMLTLAKPLTASDLATLSQRLGVAVVLTNRETLLLAVGAPESLEELRSVIQLDATQPIVAGNGNWTAVSAPLAPDLLVWIHTNTTPIALRYEKHLTSVLITLWVGAVLFTLACFFFGFRTTRRPPPANTSSSAIVDGSLGHPR